MYRLKIDLKTAFLDDNMRVHLVRPGGKYALYKNVRRQNVLPTDAPFLEVPPGVELPEAGKIADQLERARVLREWARYPLHRREKERRPSISLGDYRLVDEDRAATRTRIRNAANEILYGIPEGDLVVVPSSSLAGKAIIARVSSRDDIISVAGIGAYSEFKFPARRLLDQTSVPMVDLPDQVIKAVRTVKVVETISGHAEDRILRMYFGDYHRSQDHVTGLVGRNHDFDARVLARAIELHMAIEHALKTRQPLRPGQALYKRDVEDAPLFHARVDSPNGRAFLESSTAITFAVKLLMIVATSSVPAELAAQAIENNCVDVVNSGDGHGQETIRASKEAIVDFAAINGYNCVSDYVAALQDGLERNNATIAGTATLEDDAE